MMKLCLCLLLASASATQLVFPEANPGKAKDSVNIDNKLIDILVTSNRNGFTPPASSDSDACITPSQGSGVCGPLSQCPQLIPLLKQIEDRSTVEFLRNSVCRIPPGTIHFCCPVTTTSVSPDPTEPAASIAIAIPVPEKGECGLPSGDRVIGGFEVRVGSWPWLSVVGLPIENNGFLSICGGTIITRRHVLSAAHCFVSGVPESTHVRVGEHNLTSDNDGLVPQDIRILSRITNNYNGITKENDIELLILDEDVIFHDFVKAACLPIEPTLRSNAFEGENATVIGWGRFTFDENATTSSQVPMQADVPIVDLQPCSEIYETRTLSTVVDERNICAGQGLADACSGDSGGPLNYLNPDNDRYYVIGVVSHGVNCASSEFAGVYTRVGAYADWLLTSIRAGIASS